ncbi:MAG: dihydropyrimidinase, partial [Chloroflexota bacterium]
MTDLVVRGGTVVTPSGSRVADIAIVGGRIEAIGADLSGPAAAADAVVDASGMLVLPGVVDVHTHTRVASDDQPDRFFQDSVAAAYGGTTSFLSFNNPGTGSSAAAELSLLTGVREWRAATDGDSAIDYGLSLAVSGRCTDPLAELPATIEAGVATSKAFMVFDFRLPDARLFEAMGLMAAHGGMLQVHCEDPVLLDAAVEAALQRGDVSPRYHATTRPSYVEAVATARALAFARMADAPVHVVHLSSAAALDEVRRAKAAGVRVSAETCPHYLVLTEERYDDPDPAACARYV